jgi:hypothetical protein
MMDSALDNMLGHQCWEIHNPRDGEMIANEENARTVVSIEEKSGRSWWF